jgi:hypothetical protein
MKISTTWSSSRMATRVSWLAGGDDHLLVHGDGMRERAHAPGADQPAACVRGGREGQHREHGEHENGVHLSASR